MAETYGNFYLQAYGSQQTENAQIVAYQLQTNAGFTFESACAVLGNMQSESTINAGIYESLNSGSTTNGFGLVQWTPNTKYIRDWAIPMGYTEYNMYGRISPQVQRIKFELDYGLQWISTSQYPMSFQEFSKSTLPPDYLAAVFITNYERPANNNQPIRGTQALYWYNNLEGGGVIPPDPDPNTRQGSPIWQWLFQA